MSWAASYEIARETATDIRRMFTDYDTVYFPVFEVAKWFNVTLEKSRDPEARWQAALAIAKQFNVVDKLEFALHLLTPLHLVESICVDGRVKTGKKWFFGLFEKTRCYTTQELANMFGVPLQVMRYQLGKLV